MSSATARSGQCSVATRCRVGSGSIACRSGGVVRLVRGLEVVALVPKQRREPVLALDHPAVTEAQLEPTRVDVLAPFGDPGVIASGSTRVDAKLVVHRVPANLNARWGRPAIPSATSAVVPDVPARQGGSLDGRSAFEVRRVGAGEGARLRELRLRALADAPHAFYSSLAEEESRPLEEWERHAASLAGSGDEAMFVGVERGRWVGMAGAVLNPAKPGTATTWAGWVDPTARKRGLGVALVEAVAGWARQRGASRLELAVAETNESAMAFCRRAGFRPTGEVKPVPWDRAIKGIFLELPLAAGDPVLRGARGR
jgi:GNAT superfamily N-acetyltransferase